MKYLSNGIKLLNLINDYGYEAYIVGGAVRDYLLGMDVNDIDITTSMPLELINKFFKVKDNGSKYLSLTILYEDSEYEITNFRSDDSYLDHRHPEVKIVDSIDLDLKRRDYTINAILMDKDMDIIDKYNGINDLNKKVIKLIGDPDKRLDEDALRILRGLYLKAKLDFEFDKDTFKAIINKKELLKTLSNERLYEYFLKLIPYKTDKLIDFIKINNLFSEINDYLLWLVVVNDTDYLNNLLRFYAKYHKLPPYYLTKYKKYLTIYDNLVNTNFDILALYESKDEIAYLYDALEFRGYNVKDIKNKIDNLKLKSDNDLKVSKEIIASNFDGSKKKFAINEVIRRILVGSITNSISDIEKVIMELKHE